MSQNFELLNKVDPNLLHESYTEFKLGDKTYWGNNFDLSHPEYMNTYNILTPLSLNSNMLSSGGGQYCDVDVTGGSTVHKCDTLTLSVKIRNNNATNPAIVVPLSYILNRIEILTDGKTSESLYSDNLFLQSLLSSQEYINQAAKTEGFNPSTYGIDAAGIPALSSRTYSLNIHSFIQKLFLPTCNSIRLRFYFNGGSSIMSSTSVATANDLVCESLNVYLQGRVYNSDIKRQLVSRFRSATHISRGIIRRHQVISLGAVTASQEYSQTISSMTGNMVFLRVYMKTTGATQQNVLPNAQIAFQDISLLDSSGQAHGFQNIPAQLISNTFIPSKYMTLSTTVVPFLELDFSDSPREVFQYQNSRGTLFMDGRFLIKGRAAASGNFDLYCDSLQEVLVSQLPNGQINIQEL